MLSRVEDSVSARSTLRISHSRERLRVALIWFLAIASMNGFAGQIAIAQIDKSLQGEWCKFDPSKSDRHSIGDWALIIKSNEIDFVEAGICRVRATERARGWTTVRCLFLDEDRKRLGAVRLSKQDSLLIFSSESPRAFNHIPRMLEKCTGSKIDYGSRTGMQLTIRGISGQDTQNAVMKTEMTRDDAIGFCEGYRNNRTEKCIKETLQSDLADEVNANCITGQFTNFYRQRLSFEGRDKVEVDVNAKFLIRNLDSGEVASGSSASGYEVDLAIYRALCPKSVPSTDH